MHYALGAVASAAYEVPEVTVVVFTNGQATDEYMVKMSDVIAALNQEISEEEFASRIKRSEVGK